MSSNAYPYSQNIRSPSQLGMSPGATAQDLTNDISGLQSYISLLSNGTNTPASATGGPLGNKFFLKTEGTCSANGTNVDRYIYVNNVPNGNIPFISSGLGVNFTEFRGLIPGAIQDLNVLSPYGIMQSFLSGATPPCELITMETVDVNNRRGTQTQYVTTSDIKRMDPCDFVVPPMPGKKTGVNPANPTSRCRQAFQNMKQEPLTPASYQDEDFPDDVISQIYFICLSVLGVLLLYKIASKK
jgi:hypothetical protein